MKIEKAIEILDTLAKQTQPGPEQDELDAIQLAIEALKRYQDLRSQRVILSWERLPGETE